MNDVTLASLTLPGGPRLAVATLPRSLCAAFGVFVAAGSRDDPADRQGLAHFTEHMLFKGTARRTARDLSIDVEGAGANLNACTSEDQTAYEARGEAHTLPLLADVICDMAWHSAFAPAEIALERAVIRDEITMYRESPADHVGDLLAQALWPDHPLGHPISGSHESVKGITRDDFLAFTARHYRCSDLILAAAGPFPADQVADLLIPLLDGIPFCQPSTRQPDPPSAAPAQLVESRATDQLQLALGFRTPGRLAPQRHALRLLSLLLGEMAGSRLFQELREKRGLCYSITSDLALFRETGSLEILTAMDPADRSEALARIGQELTDLAQNGPAADELARAKRYALGQATLAFEATASHLAWAAETLLHHGRVIDPVEIRREIEAVTAEDVHAAAAALDLAHPAMAEIRPRPARNRTPRAAR